MISLSGEHDLHGRSLRAPAPRIQLALVSAPARSWAIQIGAFPDGPRLDTSLTGGVLLAVTAVRAVQVQRSNQTWRMPGSGRRRREPEQLETLRMDRAGQFFHPPRAVGLGLGRIRAKPLLHPRLQLTGKRRHPRNHLAVMALRHLQRGRHVGLPELPLSSYELD